MTPKEIAQAVVEALQAARTAQDVSYRRLEESTGVNYMRLQRVLKGETEMLIRELDAVADALGLIGWQVLRDAEKGGQDAEVVDFPQQPSPEGLKMSEASGSIWDEVEVAHTEIVDADERTRQREDTP